VALPDFSFDDDHPVLAYYYGWWEPDRLNAGVDQPILQPSNGASHIDADPSLMAAHVSEAINAGIDGFVVNTTATLYTMLNLVHGSQFRVTLQIDPSKNTETILSAYYQLLQDPNLLRYQGKPVLFFWQTAGTNPERWSALRNRVNPDHRALWIADGDKFGVLQQPAFDGISPYAVAWSANPAGTLASWAAAAAANAPDKLFIPPVSPGCNDAPARTPATCVRDRADGAFYEAAWSGALRIHPQWAVIVSTWNEWLEDTAIEPAVQYGDEYL
jgi:hypothetical protein